MFERKSLKRFCAALAVGCFLTLPVDPFESVRAASPQIGPERRAIRRFDGPVKKNEFVEIGSFVTLTWVDISIGTNGVEGFLDLKVVAGTHSFIVKKLERGKNQRIFTVGDHTFKVEWPRSQSVLEEDLPILVVDQLS
jgi:hypothetical protein